MREIVYQRPPLYPKQEAALFNDSRYVIVEASTKSGKTYGCIVWILERAFLHGFEGSNHWWVAPVSDQADIAFRRIKAALAHRRDLFHINGTRKIITLANGAMIWFKSGDRPDSLYGDDVYDIVVDEASRFREAAFTALRTTITKTRGRMRLIGNVKGRKNFAYRLARLAEKGRPGWHYAKLTVWDAVAADIFPKEEAEDAKAVLRPDDYQELYMATAVDDSSNPFGLSAIEVCVKPQSERSPTAFGLDLGRKLDWTVLIGLDNEQNVCRFHRWQQGWEKSIAKIISMVGDVPTLVDCTGIGDPVLERLQAEGGHNFHGFTFSQKSKESLIEDLTVAIQRREITFPEGTIRQELEDFSQEYITVDGAYRGTRYEAASGHDDCVIALALAARHHRVGAPKEVELLAVINA